MNYEGWVLDATLDDGSGLHCFCPVEGDDIVTGMNLLTDVPPGPLVGVIHADGQEAVEAWCEEHADMVDRIYEESRKEERSLDT